MPLLETVKVEDMSAFAPDERTVISWNFASGAAAIIGHSTNATKVVKIVRILLTTTFANIPMPLGYAMPVLYCHFHL